MYRTKVIRNTQYEFIFTSLIKRGIEIASLLTYIYYPFLYNESIYPLKGSRTMSLGCPLMESVCLIARFLMLAMVIVRRVESVQYKFFAIQSTAKPSMCEIPDRRHIEG